MFCVSQQSCFRLLQEVVFLAFWHLLAGLSSGNLMFVWKLNWSLLLLDMHSYICTVSGFTPSPSLCTSLSIHFLFLSYTFSSLFSVALCCSHFLLWPCTLRFTQPNFKQIWQEGVGLCKRGREEGTGPPLRKETAWSDCSERLKLMVLMDRCFLFRGQDFHVREGLWRRGSLCLVCVFCPTGNNPSDSITLRRLSQPHDLPGRLSALLSLLASLFGPTRLSRCSSFVCLCQHCAVV